MYKLFVVLIDPPFLFENYVNWSLSGVVVCFCDLLSVCNQIIFVYNLNFEQKIQIYLLIKEYIVYYTCMLLLALCA